MYIHERKDWPKLTWDEATLAPLLAEVRHRKGRLLGRMEALSFELRAHATLQALTQDVVKTSEIEGEKLDTQQVRSSIARRLAIDIGALSPADRHVDGIVEVMLDATRNFAAPLTASRLLHWHALLFPITPGSRPRIRAGEWRTDERGPMQVVSGPFGREKVHYEAPFAPRLRAEMQVFLKWIETPANTDPVLRAALAHFWFVTIHPFDDGNGRIARAIADLMLARSEHSPQRFYSMSAQIQHERKFYYDMLERSQKGGLNITPWIDWFLHCLQRSVAASEIMLQAILQKAHFWKIHHHEPFNDRQRHLLNRLLDGFDGKLTSTKWAKLTHCSQDTASRDINDLLGRNILTKGPAGGRSASYLLNPS